MSPPGTSHLLPPLNRVLQQQWGVLCTVGEQALGAWGPASEGWGAGGRPSYSVPWHYKGVGCREGSQVQENLDPG